MILAVNRMLKYISYCSLSMTILLVNADAAQHEFRSGKALCVSFFNKEFNANNEIFVKSNNIWRRTRPGKLSVRPQGKIFYYLRSNVLSQRNRKSGGVVIVKSGKSAVSGKSRVKLHIQSNRFNKIRTTDCKANKNKLVSLLGKNKHLTKTITISKYQEYINTNVTIRSGEDRAFHKFMDSFHFHYRKFVADGCDLNTKSASNRRQASLLSVDTGAGGLLSIFRAFIRLGPRARAQKEQLKNSRWDVRMIPYDWKRKSVVNGRACLRVKLNDLPNVNFLRINDLAFRPAGDYHGDTEWLR